MVDSSLFVIGLLTISIHFLSTLSLSVKMVGIETKKMAATYSVYNIIFLFTRFANTLQAPLLSKTVELEIIEQKSPNDFLFTFLIALSFIGAFAGLFAINFTINSISSVVQKAHHQNSITRVFKEIKLERIKSIFSSSLASEKVLDLKKGYDLKGMPISMIGANLAIQAILTVSVLSCLYAGYLNPSLRGTCISLNGFIVGFATVLSILITEPHIGILADKVAFEGMDKNYFKRYLKWVIVARVAGTGLGIFLLIPTAHLVVFLAENLF
ncbi:lipid II flippase family protein [Arcticibacterium luteifluviistationis]|uniref:Lipid II flippase Amj n=1 Tax=Arcticibacterium luteifluviistationis TaxID=1784714 RepID=A0A2Z4GFH2_9BACT|nr:DUF2837 family protein [Arcticibacterium luteifluviistationis]AWV99990.1 hypothetical protein DJ013_18190 [Arcticibacterium luteifluviistationis]